MKPTDIVPLIEGEPYISSVPVEPGLTNTEKKATANALQVNLQTLIKK